MGSLTLPSSGSVYVDAQVLIYSVEKHPVFAPLLRPLWAAVQNESIEAVTSELSLMETLVGPLKRGDARLQSDYERLFSHRGLRLLPVTQPVLRQAAFLRATVSSLRTPDAIHAAASLLHRSAAFVTNDGVFRNLQALSPIILADVLP